MTLEAGKEMDKRCVLNWLYELYVTPSRAFDEYTEDELKMFAHDALALLKEQENRLVSVKDRMPDETGKYYVSGCGKVWFGEMMCLGGMKGWINSAKKPTVEAWMPPPEAYKDRR